MSRLRGEERKKSSLSPSPPHRRLRKTTGLLTAAQQISQQSTVAIFPSKVTRVGERRASPAIPIGRVLQQRRSTTIKPKGTKMRPQLLAPADPEPRQFLCDLSMLISEARVPDARLKGRSEGPHCPSLCQSTTKGQQSQEATERHSCEGSNPLVSENSCQYGRTDPVYLHVYGFLVSKSKKISR